jgi:hypothetical protein
MAFAWQVGCRAHQIWRAFELQPHRSQSVKFSMGRRLIDKVRELRLRMGS